MHNLELDSKLHSDGLPEPPADDVADGAPGADSPPSNVMYMPPTRRWLVRKHGQGSARNEHHQSERGAGAEPARRRRRTRRRARDGGGRTVQPAAGRQTVQGSFVSSTIMSTARWTAPDSAGMGVVSLSITDGANTVTGELTMTVEEPPPNTLPVRTTSCTPCTVTEGGDVELIATATDAADDPLTYSWSAAEASWASPTRAWGLGERPAAQTRSSSQWPYPMAPTR